MQVEGQGKFYSSEMARLWNAVETLATKSGSITDRVCEAFIHELAVMSAQSFPEELRGQFEELRQDFNEQISDAERKMAALGLPTIPGIEAAKSRIHPARARRLAGAIFALCRRLAYRIQNELRE